MSSKVNYTVVGLFIVVLGSVLVLITLWLTAGHRNKVYNTYLAYMTEGVSGLSEQSPVEFNGVKVGYVDEIRLNPENLQQVILELKIEQDVPITTSTYATLVAQGITGLTYVGLKAKTAKAPLLAVEPGQQYPIIKSEPSLLVQLDTAVREITANIQSLSASVQKVFSEQNQEAVSASLQNIDKLTTTFAKNSAEIDASLKNANRLLKNAADASQQLPKVAANLNTTLNTIRKTTAILKQTSKQAGSTINDFSNQTMPNVNQLIDTLNTMADNLEQLSEKLNNNPSVIIRGQLPPPLGPGES